jgi:E1A/CREB-binding protein
MISDLREKYLPMIYDKWDNLTSEAKDRLSTLHSFACRMHLLVNFATDACKILKVFEGNVSDGINPLSFSSSNQDECGSSRLVRTAAKAFTEKGSDKAGVASHFNTFLDGKHRKNCLITFRGHRVNMLFQDAAAAYYHLDDIREFLNRWNEPNRLLQSIMFDMKEKVYEAGIRALGILYKVIMEPFWTILMHKGSILDLNVHLHQMQLCLEKWTEDSSQLFSGESCFENVSAVKDDIHMSLFTEASPEIEAYTTMALELLCGQLLIVLERQAKSQLPGGKYWETPDSIKEATSHVKKTNIDSERDMAMIDFLLKTKPSIQPCSLETYVMWLQNKPSKWLTSLSIEEKEATLNAARAAAPHIKEVFRSRKDMLVQKKKEQLEARQKKKEDKEEKVTSSKIEITRKISEYGGPWLQSEVDKKLADIEEDRHAEAILAQLKFHLIVLQSRGRKELFQKTSKGKTFSVQDLLSHLKEILVSNPTADITNKSKEQTLTYKPDTTLSAEHLHQKKILAVKLKEARRKRLANQQKIKLPDLISNPQSLVGKDVSHCCKENQVTDWFNGKVKGIWQNKEDAIKTEYIISYNETPDEEWHMPLLVDLSHGDLIIL